MTTIYKYPMSEETSEIQMPAGAKILCIQMQNNIPTIWALVDETVKLETRDFQTVGTGWPLNEAVLEFPFVGTVQDSRGLVWHIFETTKAYTDD